MAKSNPSLSHIVTISKATYGPYSSLHSFSVHLNQVPNRVVLKAPEDNMITLQPRPTFTWFVPADPENQALHFEIQIDTNQNFNSQSGGLPLIRKFSQELYTGFDFTNPKPAGVGEASYTPNFDLADRTVYYWRVRAADGQSFGEWSIARKLTSGIVATKIQLTADRVYLPAYGVTANIHAAFVDAAGNIDVYMRELVTFVQSQPLIGNFTPVSSFPSNGITHTSYAASGRHGATQITALTDSNLPCEPLVLRTVVVGEVPTLLFPANGIRLATGTLPRFTWMVPDDPEGDLLHFRLEVYDSSSLTPQHLVYVADSKLDVRGFSFSAPVAPLSLDVWHDVQVGNFVDQAQTTFDDGQYWWRVIPYDSAYKTGSIPFTFSLPNEMTIVSKPLVSTRPITQAVVLTQLTIDPPEEGKIPARVRHYITNMAMEIPTNIVWEDITENVASRTKYVFKNTAPPEHGWALAVKTVIEANESTGLIALDGHGVVFDGNYVDTNNEDYIGTLSALTPVGFQAYPTTDTNMIALNWSYVDLNSQGRRIIDKFIIEVYNPTTGLYEPYDGVNGEVLA